MTCATPTIPTKPFGSRSVPETVAPHSAGIFDGREIIALTAPDIKSQETSAEFLIDVNGASRTNSNSLTIPRNPYSLPSIIRVAAITEMVCASPFRSNSMISSLPADVLITSTSLAQLFTGTPLRDVMTSPACKPAISAGDCGSVFAQAAFNRGTHEEISEMVVVGFAVPIPAKIISRIIKPRTKCRKEPAPSTTSLRPEFALKNARDSSPAGISSVAVMPSMRQYPPAGIALIPNSVSPRVNDHILFPKPRKNSLTRIPYFFAVM